MYYFYGKLDHTTWSYKYSQSQSFKPSHSGDNDCKICFAFLFRLSRWDCPYGFKKTLWMEILSNQKKSDKRQQEENKKGIEVK